MDFIDINMGCPIDIVVNKGAGSALLTKPMRMKSVIEGATATVDTPITIKVNCTSFIQEKLYEYNSVAYAVVNWLRPVFSKASFYSLELFF